MTSEFSCGYALMEELATGYHGVLCGAPVFPSLIAEGAAGGYNLELPLVGRLKITIIPNNRFEIVARYAAAPHAPLKLGFGIIK